MALYVKTVLVGTVLLLGGWAMAAVVPFRIDGGTLEVFLGLFGAFYAIIIGFIIFIAMEHYQRIRDGINAEVNALQDLRDYLIFVDDNDVVVQAIRADLRQYVSEVVHKEWAVMTRGRTVPADDRDTPEALLQLMQSVNRIDVRNKSDDVALELIVDTIAQITTLRTNRLGACGHRLSPALRQLVLGMSLLASLLFWFLHIEASEAVPQPIVVSWVLSAINAYSVMFIYFIVTDLDDPFRGTWSIDRAPFEDLLGRLDPPEVD